MKAAANFLTGRNEDLRKAAEEGKVDEIEKLLGKDVDVNTSDSRTPFAALFVHSQLIALLCWQLQ